MEESASWWLAGGATALWVAREFIGAMLSRKKDRTETDANVELLNSLREGLESLGSRIRSMEDGHERLSRRLEEEIALRMKAQSEAHRLRLRVHTLESAMRQIGAVIPTEPQDPFQT